MQGGRAILLGFFLLSSAGAIWAQDATWAQETQDFGLPPQSGSQYPVLPPPSGSQYPALPPPSGQRYAPGVGGEFGSGVQRRRVPPPQPLGSGELGVAGQLSPATPAPQVGEIDRIAEIGPALRRCWNPPHIDGPGAGAMATVRFSLRRDGSLFGQPRVTWGTKRSDPDLQERFTRSVIAAVQACTPMRLSQRLGASIAGRPFSIRFHGRAPSNERQI